MPLKKNSSMKNPAKEFSFRGRFHYMNLVKIKLHPTYVK